jgi:hypothetical protein
MFAVFFIYEQSGFDHHMTDRTRSQATINRLEGRLRELKRKVGLYKTRCVYTTFCFSARKSEFVLRGHPCCCRESRKRKCRCGREASGDENHSRIALRFWCDFPCFWRGFLFQWAALTHLSFQNDPGSNVCFVRATDKRRKSDESWPIKKGNWPQ